MFAGNIRFLVITGTILFSAVAFFIWVCVTGKSEYQRMLNKFDKSDK